MKVLVTGAGGHLGTNLVGALAAAGHWVRGSIRRADDAKTVARLTQQGAREVVGARLESEAELRAAMDGMDVLFHTAAVYLFYAPGRDDEIVSASVDGVRHAMLAAGDAGIRRVVLTSSIAALPMRAAGAPVVTEADWADDLRVAYFRAKTLAEKSAWDLARDLGLDLVTLLPGAFAGPGFDRPTPTVDLFGSIMKGAMDLAAPPISYPYVDVRDVADAHVLALGAAASGRYIVLNDTIPTFAEIARLMHDIDPAIPKPMLTLPGFVFPMLPMLDAFNSWMNGTSRTMTPEIAATLRGKAFNLSTARIRQGLGWQAKVSLRQSLADTIDELRRREAAKT